MTRPLLILRPQPGAARTAARAVTMDLQPVVAPLFTVAPLDWTAPDPAGFDALLLTSANAVRHGGPQLVRYANLPVHAVGAATAEAARQAGFGPVMAGTGNAAELVASLASGLRLLHLCGAHRSVSAGAIVQVPVYRADAETRLSEDAIEALRADAMVVLHSPRAARLFATLFDQAGLSRADTGLITISTEAVLAAGTGWRICVPAFNPTDAAMLAIARELCETPPS